MATGKFLLAGIAGGIAGGMVMSMGMMIGKRMGVIKTPMPLKIERELERRAGISEKTSPRQERALAMGEHLMISAGFGALFGLLQSALQFPLLLGGAVYGLLVYAVNLAGIGPALDLTKGPWKEEPMTVARRVMMHMVYGIVAALVSDQFRRRTID